MVRCNPRNASADRADDGTAAPVEDRALDRRRDVAGDGGRLVALPDAGARSPDRLAATRNDRVGRSLRSADPAVGTDCHPTAVSDAGRTVLDGNAGAKAAGGAGAACRR